MYIIPRNISSRFEFMPGFGWKELLIVLGAFFIGLVLQFLFGILGLPVGIRVLLVIFFVAVGFGAVSPVMADGSTALDLLRYMFRFGRSQKLYLYRKRGL